MTWVIRGSKLIIAPAVGPVPGPPAEPVCAVFVIRAHAGQAFLMNFDCQVPGVHEPRSDLVVSPEFVCDFRRQTGVLTFVDLHFSTRDLHNPPMQGSRNLPLNKKKKMGTRRRSSSSDQDGGKRKTPPVVEPEVKGANGKRLKTREAWIDPEVTAETKLALLEGPREPMRTLRPWVPLACLCDPSVPQTLSHIGQCKVAVWEKRIVAAQQQIQGEAFERAKKLICGLKDEDLDPFQPPQQPWPLPLLEHQLETVKAYLKVDVFSFVRLEENRFFSGKPTNLSAFLQKMATPGSPGGLQRHWMLDPEPVLGAKPIWNDPGFMPAAVTVVNAVRNMCVRVGAEFDLFQQGVLPCCSLFGSAVSLVSIEEAREQGYPLVDVEPGATKIFRLADPLIQYFLLRDVIGREPPALFAAPTVTSAEPILPDRPDAIPDRDEPGRRRFLEPLLEQVGLLDKARCDAALIVDRGLPTRRSRAMEVIEILSDDDEDDGPAEEAKFVIGVGRRSPPDDGRDKPPGEKPGGAKSDEPAEGSKEATESDESATGSAAGPPKESDAEESPAEKEAEKEDDASEEEPAQEKQAEKEDSGSEKPDEDKEAAPQDPEEGKEEEAVSPGGRPRRGPKPVNRLSG